MTTTPEKLRELAQRGVGFDMNPTMMFTTAEAMYSQWLDYFTRLDREWRERVAAAADALSSPPADDVRDAMEQHLREAVRLGIGWPKATYLDPWIAERLDAIFAALEVRPRGTVTDAEVEAAARAYAGDEMSAAEWEWVKTQPHLAEPYLTGMRAALEAAREARS